MPPKSNNQKKKEAEAAGKPPKKTKQQENAGKTAAGKKKEMQAKRAADKVKNRSKIDLNFAAYRFTHLSKIQDLYLLTYKVDLYKSIFVSK